MTRQEDESMLIAASRSTDLEKKKMATASIFVSSSSSPYSLSNFGFFHYVVISLFLSTIVCFKHIILHLVRHKDPDTSQDRLTMKIKFNDKAYFHHGKFSALTSEHVVGDRKKVRMLSEEVSVLLYAM